MLLVDLSAMQAWCANQCKSIQWLLTSCFANQQTMLQGIFVYMQLACREHGSSCIEYTSLQQNLQSFSNGLQQSAAGMHMIMFFLHMFAYKQDQWWNLSSQLESMWCLVCAKQTVPMAGLGTEWTPSILTAANRQTQSFLKSEDYCSFTSEDCNTSTPSKASLACCRPSKWAFQQTLAKLGHAFQNMHAVKSISKRKHKESRETDER